MARLIKNSRLNRRTVSEDEAFLRVLARKEDMDQDAKVDQIADQPGRGRRPARRTRDRSRNY